MRQILIQMRRYSMLLVGIIVTGFPTMAQEVLTLEEAVSHTLENNFNIRLVTLSKEVAANNVSLGNAGMLPVLSADVSTAAGIQNTTQTLLSGETRSVDGAESRSLSYGVNLQWTLFDGFQMFTRYEQLKQLQARGEEQWRADVLNAVYGVYQLYYDLVKQKQLIHASQTALQLSQYRMETATHRYQIGRASKLEVLNAQVDLNADTTNLLRQLDEFRNTQVYLNEQMARDVQLEFDVADEMEINEFINFEQLDQIAKAQNPDVKLALVDLRLSELEEKRVKGQRYPVIHLSSAYTRSRSHAELGFSTESRGNGFNVGLSAHVNIFNGFIQRKNEQNAAIESRSAGLRVEEAIQFVDVQLVTAYRRYQTQLDLVRLEQNNLQLAEENLDITMEKFQLGSIPSIEFREAQRNFVDASTRYSNALLECKMAEIDLKHIAGVLNLD